MPIISRKISRQVFGEKLQKEKFCGVEKKFEEDTVLKDVTVTKSIDRFW